MAEERVRANQAHVGDIVRIPQAGWDNPHHADIWVTVTHLDNTAGTIHLTGVDANDTPIHYSIGQTRKIWRHT